MGKLQQLVVPTIMQALGIGYAIGTALTIHPLSTWLILGIAFVCVLTAAFWAVIYNTINTLQPRRAAIWTGLITIAVAFASAQIEPFTQTIVLTLTTTLLGGTLIFWMHQHLGESYRFAKDGPRAQRAQLATACAGFILGIVHIFSSITAVEGVAAAGLLITISAVFLHTQKRVKHKAHFTIQERVSPIKRGIWRRVRRLGVFSAGLIGIGIFTAVTQAVYSAVVAGLALVTFTYFAKKHSSLRVGVGAGLLLLAVLPEAYKFIGAGITLAGGCMYTYHLIRRVHTQAHAAEHFPVTAALITIGWLSAGIGAVIVAGAMTAGYISTLVTFVAAMLGWFGLSADLIKPWR